MAEVVPAPQAQAATLAQVAAYELARPVPRRYQRGQAWGKGQSGLLAETQTTDDQVRPTRMSSTDDGCRS